MSRKTPTKKGNIAEGLESLVIPIAMLKPDPRNARKHPERNLIPDGSKLGGVVFDLFGGSGTTMIACEKTGRKCRMMEIDEHYCDVIITRWQDFTGKKAELINGP